MSDDLNSDALSSFRGFPSNEKMQFAPLREESALPKQIQDVPYGATVVEGGVAAPLGFRAAGVHAGFRKNAQRLDLALVVADEPCAAVGVFTKNVFCAAPVTLSRRHLDSSGGRAQALVVNSGNANAATGPSGEALALEAARLTARIVHCAPDEVLIASTGVIGESLSLAPYREGLQRVYSQLSCDGGTDAARAIMTTDTHPKECAISFKGDDIGYPGAVFTVGGMAKGSGMIMPDMATMIACLTTDAPLLPDALHDALTAAVSVSFNKVTVDSDTSTNDTCILFANGAATHPSAQPFTEGSSAFKRFQDALVYVCSDLARQMARDGEGATCLISVRVSGAQNAEEADKAARCVANSPLVKTAIFGHDANWGRIAAALGRSGARFSQHSVAIDIMGIPVCRGGQTVAFSEDVARDRFAYPEICIDIDLGVGDAQTCVWTCDLTHDYITINGDYRT